MLHQTLPLFFHFNLPSSPSISPHYSLLSPHYYSLQEEVTNMEAKALKTSFWPEMTQQTVVVDDIWGSNVGNGVCGDDFFVDELLNFSKEEEGFLEEEEEEEEKEDSSNSMGSHEDNHTNASASVSAFSLKTDFDSLPTSELSVPTDDIADLEWLSNFVDDSTEFSLSIPVIPQTRSEPVKPIDSSVKPTTFSTPIPVKARTKRNRTGGPRIWTKGSTTTSSSSSTSSSTSCLIFTPTAQNLDLFYCLAKPPIAKKPKKKHVGENGGGMQRRCSHCGVQKTPQWRSGPMGAKTLCNACGVRYKSGRLLPEYRPACSPTFSSEVHSNSHRKVLEMRKKKDMIMGPEVVRSF